MSQTLFDITEDMHALDQLIDECDNYEDPRIIEAVNDWFKELGDNLKGKVDNYAAYITELIARAHARTEEAQRLANRAKADKNTADWLKFRLKVTLAQRGIGKLDTARFRVSIAKNGGKVPVNIFQPNAVPHEYCRHVPERWEPDTDKIREAGKEVPGATINERGTHLRIK